MNDSWTKPMSRRQFAQAAGSVLASCAVGTGCQAPGDSTPPTEGTITARPSATTTASAAGTQALGLGAGRDAVLHVPSNTGDGPLPLIVLLHGAGGSGSRFLQRLAPIAEAYRVALLAPDSRGRTWDALRTEPHTLFDIVTSERHFLGFGPDIEFLERALERVFRTVAIDSTRVVVGGFSDGATYALTLGLINGNLFRRIVAFSPGFIVAAPNRGRPEIFVSHGRGDEILPIDRCSRRIVPDLRQRGYTVTFREFDGGHQVPNAVANEAMAWAIRPAPA